MGRVPVSERWGPGAGGRHREGAGRAHVKVVVVAEVMVGAVVDGQGEGLGGVGQGAVGRGDGDRVACPPVPAAGVPDSTPVVESRVTPVGRVPVSEKVGAGLPVAVTVKVPAVPTVKVVVLAEVMAGAGSTVRVKDWVALGRVPLAAVMVIG